jgi:hypothetical protein
LALRSDEYSDRKAFLIVVEGQDEVAVLELLLHDLGIDTVQTIDAKGKDNIRDVIKILAAQEGFISVEGVAIVRDADTNPAAAGQHCVDILQGSGGRTGYFVLPGEERAGMLEDLCLQAFQERPEMQCVESSVACIGGSNISLSNLPKFRMKAFLMMHDEDTTRKIGWAALRGLISPEHEAFGPLRRFLRDFTRV